MKLFYSLPLLSIIHLSNAHFSVNYPYWRGDSFATQWERPCGGVNQSLSSTNRTAWPLTGGSLSLHVGHHWAYTFINLALGGDNTTNFNITLVEGFNQTGNGTFCIPKVAVPEGTPVEHGTEASIQVVQVNEHGSALYNCADITFSSNATILGEGQCTNSTGVGGQSLEASETEASSTAASSASAAAATPTGAAARVSTESVGYALLCCVLGAIWL